MLPEDDLLRSKHVGVPLNIFMYFYVFKNSFMYFYVF